MALRRQRQKHHKTGQPGLHIKFQDDQDYIKSACLKTRRRKKKEEEQQQQQNIFKTKHGAVLISKELLRHLCLVIDGETNLGKPLRNQIPSLCLPSLLFQHLKALILETQLSSLRFPPGRVTKMGKSRDRLSLKALVMTCEGKQHLIEEVSMGPHICHSPRTPTLRAPN